MEPSDSSQDPVYVDARAAGTRRRRCFRRRPPPRPSSDKYSLSPMEPPSSASPQDPVYVDVRAADSHRRRRQSFDKDSKLSIADNSSSSPLVTCRQQAHYDGDGDGLQDLAFPLGVSFASVVSQVLDWNILSKGTISADYLSHICTLAVKESLTNEQGERFDAFIKSFDKSFGSTLKTLRKISEVSNKRLENTTNSSSTFYQSGGANTTCGSYTLNDHGSTNTTCSYSTANQSLSANAGCNSYTHNHSGNANTTCSSSAFNRSRSASTSSTIDPIIVSEDISECEAINEVSSQIVIHGQMNQQLAHISHDTSCSPFNQSLYKTFERSVIEKTRSNDLKQLELGLVVKKLELKQSQLAIQSDANILQEKKIEIGMADVSLKEEKLSCQMQKMRIAELLQTFNDLLVTGLIIMCAMLMYGGYVFSYQRIMDLTFACTPPEEKKSWWIPKRATSFISSWHRVICHVNAISRMSFGILMVLIVLFLAFIRRSRTVPSGAVMPVTFMIMLLGGICGFFGKLCVDTFGGNGYQWLVWWEVLCMLHFLPVVLPTACYRILYGRADVSRGTRRARIPYTILRYMFYIILLVLPTWTGLSPFASFSVWKEHFSQKFLG